MTDPNQQGIPVAVKRVFNVTLPVNIQQYDGAGIVLVGARCAGKTTLREELTQIDQSYYDVTSIAPKRGAREGEDLAAVQTSMSVTIDQLVEHPSPFVLTYREREQLYGYPLNHFEQNRFPILRIIGEQGLEMITTERTLPNMLRVQLTLDPLQISDLERRIISRLIRKQRLPKEFEVSFADETQKALIEGDKKYIAEQVAMFRTYDSTFDVTFCNRALPSSDPRRYLYNDENPDRIVATDIAMRLHILYQRWQATVSETRPSETRPSVIGITDKFLGEIVNYLFGSPLSNLTSGGNVVVDKTNIDQYAGIRGLNSEILNEKTRAMSVESVEPAGSVLRVYLAPHEAIPAHIRDAEHKSNLDFERLGVLAHSVEGKYKLRPRFIIHGNHIYGIEWSLSDTAPTESVKQGMYTRVEIRYKYPLNT